MTRRVNCLVASDDVTTRTARLYNFGSDSERCAMPAIDDDDRPKKKIAHEIGQDLSLLSVAELRERIALLQDEIARLEADIASKKASRDVRADQFFKK